MQNFYVVTNDLILLGQMLTGADHLRAGMSWSIPHRTEVPRMVSAERQRVVPDRFNYTRFEFLQLEMRGPLYSPLAENYSRDLLERYVRDFSSFVPNIFADVDQHNGRRRRVMPDVVVSVTPATGEIRLGERTLVSTRNSVTTELWHLDVSPSYWAGADPVINQYRHLTMSEDERATEERAMRRAAEEERAAERLKKRRAAEKLRKLEVQKTKNALRVVRKVKLD